MYKCIYYLLIFHFLIVGCSPVSSTWSCKSSINGVCKNIREIDNGYVDSKDIENNSNNFVKRFNKEYNKNHNNNFLTDFRSKEKVSRVKFSPYIDRAGNRHERSIVYFIEQKADWRE